MQQAEDIQKKEERKIIAGYASGRKGLEVILGDRNGLMNC